MEALIKFDENEIKKNLFLLAYTFGIISPKKTIIEVTIIVRETKTKPSLFVRLKKFQAKKAESVIIATFTKLFKIKIIAKSLSGSFNNLIEERNSLFFEFLSFFNS